MEPTSFNVGDYEDGIRPSTRQFASMEPTSFNVGDIDLDNVGPISQLRFNGADVFQRRRRPLSHA